MTNRRIRRPASEWAELIAQFNDSGLTVADFCAERDIAKASFQRWRQRLVTVPAERQAFVPLSSPPEEEKPPHQAWALELDLGAGMTLRIQHD